MRLSIETTLGIIHAEIDLEPGQIVEVVGPNASGGSPAHAGIDLRDSDQPRVHIRFPRPRGDRPTVAKERSSGDLVPPPTRG